MATGYSPPWLDEVLFDLQGLERWRFAAWEREFIPSISRQYANWKASTSKMPFPTQRQHDALLRIHRRSCPERHKLLGTFMPFDNPPPDTP